MTASLPKVADKIAAVLADYGTSFAVGIPGNDVLETIRAGEDRGIRFILAKSEPSAAFIADAIYQVTHKPVALIPALGPGLANAVSGLANATLDRSAMVVLCGEVGTDQAGIYTHQVFDQIALARPVTKAAWPLNPARAGQQTAQALDLALAYPPGPVMLTVPGNQSRSVSCESEGPFQPQPQAKSRPDAAAIDAALSALGAANRPLVLIGWGAVVAEAGAALEAFIDSWALPFLTTYKAKGIISEHHSLALGAAGLSPVIDALVQERVESADLLILIGFDPVELRDAWIDAWDGDKRVISIDPGSLIHRMFPTGLQITGHVPTIVTALIAPTPVAHTTAETWVAEHQSAVAEIVHPRHPPLGISPAALFAEVSGRIEDTWWLTVDVGAHRILASHVIQCLTPGQMMQSNGLCCMGYAVPAAIGAQLAAPDKVVVALVGDGCMLMSLGDLALAGELRLPIIVIVLNDAALSLIKLKQQRMQLSPLAVDFAAADFATVARGLGAEAVRVETLEAFTAAFDKALGGAQFTLIDALIDPAEYLEQM